MKSLIFKPELAQAIFEGRKTQTRRIIKPQPPTSLSQIVNTNKWTYTCSDIDEEWTPKFQIGDRFYVREKWKLHRSSSEFVRIGQSPYFVIYHNAHMRECFDEQLSKIYDGRNRWRSPLFMPEWASRSICKVTDVRVERLNDIAIDDVQAEGCSDSPLGKLADAVLFPKLWDSIHGTGAWDKNPFVWVYEFKKEIK